MDIDSNNNFFNGSDEVEEKDNSLSFNECEDDEVKEEEVEEPKKGMYFSSKEEVYAFYAEYAKHSGFAIAYRSQNLTCDGEVKYFGIKCTRARNRTKRSEINPLEPSLSSKNECKARVRASLQMDGTYKLTTVVLEHTHDLVATDSRHFAVNKRIVTPVKRRLEVNDAAGIGVAKNFHSIVVEAGGYEALTFDERDARNYINNARMLRLGVGDAESVTHYFHKMQQQNSNFYSAIDFDENGRMRNLFWADARSRAAYKAFGDFVSFDTTYLTNKYDMPFAPFVGVNYHGQSILFGCGLLSNENTETFVWLFKEWLSCMSDAPPKAIITDQCRSMQNAIEIVFLEARHRWCLWHIMKKIPEKLRGYSQYESIKVAFSNAVYDSFTIDEFEEYWEAMIENFNLNDNEWLGVLHRERHGWIPAYVKDIFWAGMSTTQRSESMNAFFVGYVNSKTTLKQFVEQYDNALRSKVEKETKADFKSRNKLYDCLTVYRFEKQFRAAYTNSKFKEVQVELKRLVYCRANLIKQEGAVCTYHVREAIVVGEGTKKVKFVVYFNSTKCEPRCMCRLFEFRGIMCAHSLSVLIERSIYEVPTRYIVSRWRKDLERGYTCIPTTYTNFGSSLHPKLHDNYHNTLDEILDLATNDDAKHKVIQLGLMKIKDEVRTVQSSSASNVPCTSTLPPSNSTLPPSHTSPKGPPRINSTKESMTRNVRSPLVARRRGRPCTKRKVSKVDAIVNWLKEKNKKVRQGEPRKLSFPCMGVVQHTMYEPAPVTTSGDDIGSTSFVDLNIDGDPNLPFFFSFEVVIVREFRL
ncbi:protein FAR1-RELATED SEQUENCE 6-like isoform X2 [Camellia sinensis]|uniref:protein FAR1-RELATED SEQUENCE 6-like isoform X2 n=1 Tax=Camellia sinensis TaxID=4442 RepID=UPI001035C3C1|nr:protein FAR1-RELATED SEQUENCE 6-like isoform X2 [Camellia sinensis]